jgi:hypothetical protein
MDTFEVSRRMNDSYPESTTGGSWRTQATQPS